MDFVSNPRSRSRGELAGGQTGIARMLVLIGGNGLAFGYPLYAKPIAEGVRR
jgi:hypothetical protein